MRRVVQGHRACPAPLCTTPAACDVAQAMVARKRLRNGQGHAAQRGRSVTALPWRPYRVAPASRGTRSPSRPVRPRATIPAPNPTCAGPWRRTGAVRESRWWPRRESPAPGRPARRRPARTRPMVVAPRRCSCLMVQEPRKPEQPVTKTRLSRQNEVSVMPVQAAAWPTGRSQGRLPAVNIASISCWSL